MSWSKIIRNAGEQRPFTLVPLGSVAPRVEQDPFRAVSLGGAREEIPESVEEEPVAPPSIPEEEALRLIREAREEGVRAGREEARGELAQAAEALTRALLAAGSLRSQLMHEAEEDLLRLSVLIARKIMLREFACDPSILAGVVHAALEVASESGEIVVLLNPDEYEAVADCREFRELASGRQVTMKGDPSVGRAGCLVQTSRGNIDAGVEAQLDDILRRLTEEKSARREEPQDD